MEFNKAELVNMLINLVEKEVSDFKKSYPSKEVLEAYLPKQQALLELVKNLK